MIQIADQDITFVVQGPVQASNDRSQISGITSECLSSIRRYFPASTIILSTWKGQPYQDLDYDQVIELDDPGSNSIYHDGKPQTLNNNRQMVSSHYGLKAVTTKYAVKIRSDNKLIGRQFVDLYRQYADLPRKEQYSLFKQRTLTSSTFFISSHHGRPVYFHKSDLFDFGLTEDLLTIWSSNWIEELSFKLRPGYKARYATTEQFLTLNWLSKLLGKPLKIDNLTGEDAGLGADFWPKFIANNIIVDAPEKLGLDITERFYNRGNLALEYDLADWLYLNNQSDKPRDIKRLYRSYKNLTGSFLRKIKG
ncbi:WavE lipopolysaccharide synthesis family protein [Vibrio sinaloensis]|uniref:WavE lipopolysaccharide synthesis family protein n=1 Tax=Photobacterium sp. (strain ATCC 43367) TaxID=379097 RepID=UPI002046B606|nr:WavE lipopolysaccharide synthesis family protein [Vibrio sinaloensis]UPQ88091.1 WavE lipopolysaccharide synthesis family protein [Vibrio sinaloensis]